MKNFKAFLTESENKTLITDRKEFIKLVQANCSEFIKNSSTKYQLYRGMNYPSNVKMGNAQIRKNRKPTDTNEEIHKALDDMFFKKFGIQYRSNAVFASSARGKADAYGEVFHIFPVNGYKLAGSLNINDLFIETTHKFGSAFFSWSAAREALSREENDLYNKMRNEYRNGPTFPPAEIQEMNQKIFDNLEYFESKKPKDFGTSEIMVSADSYYFLLDNDKGWETSTDVVEEIYLK